MHVLVIAVGGILGALSRWGLGAALNPLFPTVPLGTLVANLCGGYLIGIMVGVLQLFPTVPEGVRLGVMTGFLGSLTTFSTFSAEVVHLFSTRSYLYASGAIVAHLGGTLGMTVFGIITSKLLFGRIA